MAFASLSRTGWSPDLEPMTSLFMDFMAASTLSLDGDSAERMI
jgi:hypothetical protein